VLMNAPSQIAFTKRSSLSVVSRVDQVSRMLLI